MAKPSLSLVHRRIEHFLNESSIEAVQERQLQETLARAMAVPFYRKRLLPLGLKRLKTWKLEDTAQIPFTVKEELRGNYPWGLLAVPPEKVLRVHASSGTTGRITLSAYTEGDLKTWAELMERIFIHSGLHQGFRALNCYGYGLFTGGLGFEGGLRKIGALEVPNSIGNYERQLQFLRDLEIEVLLGTPSSAASLILFAHQQGTRLRRLKLKIGIFGGELWSEALKNKIERALHLKAFDTYGLSEVIGPGVAHQCPKNSGLHVYEDHFLAEIIDPASGERLREGEWGELVLTTLTREAMPVLRYRTRDWTRFIPKPCACGSPFRRIEKIRGRLGGPEERALGEPLNLGEVESALLHSDFIGFNYQISIKPKSARRKAKVEARVESRPGLKLNSAQSLTLQDTLGSRVAKLMNAEVRVRLLPAASLPFSLGKAERVKIEN